MASDYTYSHLLEVNGWAYSCQSLRCSAFVWIVGCQPCRSTWTSCWLTFVWTGWSDLRVHRRSFKTFLLFIILITKCLNAAIDFSQILQSKLIPVLEDSSIKKVSLTWRLSKDGLKGHWCQLIRPSTESKSPFLLSEWKDENLRTVRRSIFGQPLLAARECYCFPKSLLHVECARSQWDQTPHFRAHELRQTKTWLPNHWYGRDKRELGWHFLPAF